MSFLYAGVCLVEQDFKTNCPIGVLTEPTKPEKNVLSQNLFFIERINWLFLSVSIYKTTGRTFDGVYRQLQNFRRGQCALMHLNAYPKFRFHKITSLLFMAVSKSTPDAEILNFGLEWDSCAMSKLCCFCGTRTFSFKSFIKFDCNKSVSDWVSITEFSETEISADFLAECLTQVRGGTSELRGNCFGSICEPKIEYKLSWNLVLKKF